MLYNEYEAKTSIGQELADEVYEALLPIVTNWKQKGYKLREIQTVIDSELMLMISEEVLKNAQEKRKKVVDIGSRI